MLDICSFMNFTEYFKFTQSRSDRKDIKLEWIEKAFSSPILEVVQQDGRIRRWAYIKDVNKYLRIIVLEDEKTVHNAFFDRRFKF